METAGPNGLAVDQIRAQSVNLWVGRGRGIGRFGAGGTETLGRVEGVFCDILVLLLSPVQRESSENSMEFWPLGYRRRIACRACAPRTDLRPTLARREEVPRAPTSNLFSTFRGEAHRTTDPVEYDAIPAWFFFAAESRRGFRAPGMLHVQHEKRAAFSVKQREVRDGYTAIQHNRLENINIVLKWVIV